MPDKYDSLIRTDEYKEDIEYLRIYTEQCMKNYDLPTDVALNKRNTIKLDPEQQRIERELEQQRIERNLEQQRIDLARLQSELEQTMPEYMQLENEWASIDDEFQRIKAEKEQIEQQLVDFELTETYTTSKVSELEEALFVGYHCRDYLSHSDRNLDAFYTAVENFRKKSIERANSVELNQANYDMRKEIIGLPSIGEILRCEQKRDVAVWNCKKKAIEMSSHNANWLREWEEFSIISTSLDELQAPFEAIKLQRDELQPKWDDISKEYKQINKQLCKHGMEYC